MVRKTNNNKRRNSKRNSRANTKTIQRKARALMYQNKLQGMINRISVANHYFGCKKINQAEVGYGQINLSATTGQLPLNIISLRSICNNGENANQILKLTQTGHDFAVESSATAQYMGSTGAYVKDGALPNTTQFRQLIHRYTSMKFLFYQEPKKKVTFTLKLCKLSPDLDPWNTGLTVTDLEVKQKRRLFYQYHCLKADMTNQLLKNTENYLRDLRGQQSILWEKTYTLNEMIFETQGQDEHGTRQVNIFRKFDKIVNFTQNANPVQLNGATGTSFQNPETINYPSNNDSASSVPESRDNLFLIITSNCTQTETEDGNDFDQHSYDVLIKSKYTAPAGNIMDLAQQ